MSGARIEVLCSNEQEEVEIDTDLAAALAREVLELQGVVTASELSLVFVDPDTIWELNERYRGVDGPTDVLSFAIEDGEARAGQWPDGGGKDHPAILLGDVVIAPAIARQNAATRAGDRGHDGSVADEVALLIVHGILHILGYDHEIEAEAEKMEGLEGALLERVYAPLKVAGTRGLAG